MPHASRHRGCCASWNKRCRPVQPSDRVRRATQRYALGIEYDGSEFSGWQRLNKPGEPDRRGEPTVQAALERALSFVAGARSKSSAPAAPTPACTRPAQVVHFDSRGAARRRAAGCWAPPRDCRRRCACAGASRSPADFHARFSARARRYRYRLLNRPVRPALHRQYLSWERRPLDADAMHRAAQALVGEHDFSAFRTVHCQAPHARRDLQRHQRAPRWRRGRDRGAGQCLPAPHGAQHRRQPAAGRARRAARGLARRTAAPAATARSPGRRRPRPAWCSWVRATLQNGGFPPKSRCDAMPIATAIRAARHEPHPVPHPHQVLRPDPARRRAPGRRAGRRRDRLRVRRQEPAPDRRRGGARDARKRWRRWSMRSRCSWTTRRTKCARSIRHVRPSLLQFHGSEDDAFCRGFGVPYLKAIAMGERDHRTATRLACSVRYPAAAGFLFDSHGAGEPGGSGQRVRLVARCRPACRSRSCWPVA